MSEAQISQLQPTTQETSASTTIEQAEAVARRIEEANKRTEELVKRQEDIMARALLSGKSFAGQEPEKPKVETPKEYANRLMTGALKAK